MCGSLKCREYKEGGDKNEGMPKDGKDSHFFHLLAHTSCKPYPDSSADTWKVEI